MSIIVEPASGAGAYLSGVDLNNLEGKDLQAVRVALGEYGVVFFRNQALRSDGHIKFAEKFGDININRFFKPLDDYPKIAQVLKEPDQKKNIGEKWHTDHSTIRYRR